MKKAAVLKKDVKKGDVLSLEMINFIRTKEISDMSQVDVVQSVGKVANQDIGLGAILMNGFFIDKE
jgi:N,N'-diacetyllegionaminate synthase